MIYNARKLTQMNDDEFGEWMASPPETGAWDYTKAVVTDAAMAGPLGWAYSDAMMPDDDMKFRPQRFSKFQPSQKNAPVMDEETWKNSKYYREALPFDGRMTEARAKFKSEQYDEEQFRRYIRDNRDMGVGTATIAVVGSLAGSAIDPTNYIPIFGPAFKAAAATRAANVMRRAAIGAADAAVSTAAVQPIGWAHRSQFGDDVNYANSVLDIALSAVAGGVFGSIGGSRETLRFDRAQRAIAEIHLNANDMAEGRPLNVAQYMPQRQIDLLSGTSIGRKPDGPGNIELNAIKESNVVENVFPSTKISVPLADDSGKAISYPTREAAEIARKEWAEQGIELRAEENSDKTFILTETTDIKLLQSFPDRSSSEEVLQRMAPDERNGVDIVSIQKDGNSEFAIVRGLNERQLEAYRKNPEYLNDIIKTETTREPPKFSAEGIEIRTDQLSDSLNISKFDQAFSDANPRVNVDRVRRPGSDFTPAPADKFHVSESELQSADRVLLQKINSSAHAKIKEIADEQGIDLNAGTFEELEQLTLAVDSGSIKLNELEIKQLKEVKYDTERAEIYAKGYQVYAACNARRG